jgi:hypothetical protein
MIKKRGTITMVLSLALMLTISSNRNLWGGTGAIGVDKPANEKVDIIFVRVPASLPQPLTVSGKKHPADHRTDGSQILRLTPGSNGRKTRNLTSGFFAACDPAVSFDGRTILFAGKHKQGDHWQIWRMDPDGGKKKQITSGDGDCVSPIFVGSLFHLDDKAPTRKIVYQKDNHLFTSNLDGKNPCRITFSPYPEYEPDVLPNGRLVFSSVVYYVKKAAGRAINLHVVSIDGTDHMGYLTGAGIPGYKEMVTVGRDGRVYFIHHVNRTEAGENLWPQGGRLAYVSLHRPEHSYTPVTPEQDGLYRNPCPLPDGGLLVSFREKGADSVFGIYRIENGKVLQNVYKSGKYHCIDAQVLAPHPVVRGRSSFVEHKMDTGTLYCIDVYISQSQRIRSLPPGTVKQVRVLQADSTAPDIPVTQKILGTAPVESDGSFHIRVPAKTPITFQLLDHKGNIVANQKSWTWVQPRESRGCIGCHEDREMAPPNRSLPIALTKPAVRLPGIISGTRAAKEVKKGDR